MYSYWYMTSGIYKITNIKNGKFYLGSTKDFTRRQGDHFRDLKNGDHINKHLQNAFNLDGEENFKFEIIETCEESNLIILEQHYLDTLTPFRENGYNICLQSKGGNTYDNLSEEDKLIFKEKSKNFGIDNGMYGKSHTDESIQKQKEKSVDRFTLQWFISKYGDIQGRLHYDDRCKKQSENAKGDKNPFYGKIMKGSRFKGKTHTQETKNKMWESRKTIKDDNLFMDMIRDKSISIQHISSYFNVSDQTVRYHCKKINGHPPSHFRQ